MRMSVCLSPVALAASLALTLSAGAQSGKTWDKTYAVSASPTVTIVGGDAGIHATSCGTCREVKVHIDMHDRDLKDYRLEESGGGNSVRVELKQRNEMGWGWAKGQGPEITVQLPAESHAALTAGSGGIEAVGVRGGLEINTGSGGVKIRESAGALEAKAGSGGVMAEGGFPQFHVRAGSGSVQLRLAPGVQLRGESEITAGSGGVRLALPKDLRADVRATTGSGGIHSDLPISGQSDAGRHELNGALNGGGPRLELRTGSGGVRIEGI